MIPHYEEARQYFSRAAKDGFLEDLEGYWKGHYNWDQYTLKLIIEEYSKKDFVWTCSPWDTFLSNKKGL